MSLFIGSRAHAERPPYWAQITAAVGEIVQGDLMTAVFTLAEARKADNTPYVDALVGLTAWVGGRVKEARAMFFQAIASGCTDPEVFYWGARTVYRGRDVKEALQWTDHALAAGGHSARLHMFRTLLFLAAGRRAAAREALVSMARLQANLLDPGLYPTPLQGAVDLLPRALHDLPDKLHLIRTQGHLYWRLGLVLAAKRRFDALLVRSPKDADALQMRARCLHALGRPTKEALELAERAAALAPHSAPARAAYGELLLLSGRPDEAVVELKHAADLRPEDATVLTQLGHACAEAQQLNCASRFYGYAVRRNPRLAEAQLGLALTLQKKGQLTPAWRAAQRAAMLDPVNPKCHETLAHLARLRKQPKTAEAWTKSARRVHSGQRRAKRHEQRARKVISALDRALAACACESSCHADRVTEASCQQAVRALPGAVRLLFVAHLALVRDEVGAARARLARLLSSLRARRLLSGDVHVLTHAVKLRANRYEVRTVLPMASPALFGASH